MKNFISILAIFLSSAVFGKDLLTNEALFKDPPKWLKRPKAEKVIDRIQRKLEWTTRRIVVQWYSNQKAFERAHSLGSLPVAVTRNTHSGSTIFLGPKVDKQSFARLFGHELVHVILFQKYKGAIPKWFEEGLANHLSASEKVDYKWLARHPIPNDVTSLGHPLKGSKSSVLFRYKASQALAEMLDKKCDLENLIRLSVGRDMNDYIKTYCEIKDLSVEFKKWVDRKSGKKTKKPRYSQKVSRLHRS